MGSGRLDQQYLLQKPAGRLIAAREFCLYLFGLRRRFVVHNDSMQPNLWPGDYLLVDPSAYQHRLPSPGDLVLATHPQDISTTIIKRVGHVLSSDVWLLSDNATRGQDSRHFGAVPLSVLLGKVTAIVS